MDFFSKTYMWNDSCETIPAESVRRIMHNTEYVIVDTKIGNTIGRIRIEIVFRSWRHMLPHNGHVVITFGCTLHVIKTQSM